MRRAALADECPVPADCPQKLGQRNRKLTPKVSLFPNTGLVLKKPLLEAHKRNIYNEDTGNKAFAGEQCSEPLSRETCSIRNNIFSH